MASNYQEQQINQVSLLPQQMQGKSVTFISLSIKISHTWEVQVETTHITSNSMWSLHSNSKIYVTIGQTAGLQSYRFTECI
jgi:hypothetical protein